MTSVGWATLDVIPTFKGLQGQLEKGTGAPMAAAGKSAGRKFGDAAGKETQSRMRGYFSRTAEDAKKLLSSPLAGAAIGTAIGAGLLDVVNKASEAQQAIGGTQAVFGKYAASVIRDAGRADQALGLSSTAYQELITISGALLKNKGLTDFADQAENLIQVGADLAAQYGGSTKQAVEALNAALRGESDPIERYAISLNETAVNAELAARGQNKLTGAALEQAKTQARLAIIQKQSADAQGAFNREADTFAGIQARTTAQFADMRAELGTRVLPLFTELGNVTNSTVLPALGEAGGAVEDLAHGIAALPVPLKAAAGGWALYAVAQRAGLGSATTRGLSALQSGLESTRLRTMLAGDAYRSYRLGADQAAASNGRLGASFAAVRAGAQGAGASVTRGLSGALSLVGGPWGAAFIAGTAVVAHFWQEHQRAKQYIEDVTASLDAQTGAVTENTREKVKQQLQDEGILDRADALGVSLKTVTDAALGNTDAMAALQRIADRTTVSLTDLQDGQGPLTLSQIDATAATNDHAGAIAQLLEPLRDQAAIIGSGQEKMQQLARADGEVVRETERVVSVTERYSRTLSDARDKVQKLLDAENKRRDASLQDRRDRIALLDTLAAARKEARDGKATLDENTAAGRQNMSALLDLADQWNNSTAKVRNAKGAYDEMRQKFIDVAEKMGAAKGEARKLADEILSIPKKRATAIETPGMDRALRQLERLHALANLRDFNRIRVQVNADQALAGGGLVGGVGSGTSDSNLIWASRGEFMQRKAAVDHYGVDFMRKLNALQVPRYAQGGLIAPAPAQRAMVQGGTVVNHYGDIITERPRDYVATVRRRALGGVPIGAPR